jgi:hypothetical protein
MPPATPAAAVVTGTTTFPITWEALWLPDEPEWLDAERLDVVLPELPLDVVLPESPLDALLPDSLDAALPRELCWVASSVEDDPDELPLDAAREAVRLRPEDEFVRRGDRLLPLFPREDVADIC